MRETKETKQNAGITLIALVITIIVLLILAAVSIATLTGSNGILTRAGQAKENTEEKQTGELVKLSITDAKTQGLGTITEENLVKALDSNLGTGNYQLTGNETDGWKIKKNGKIYTVDGSGNLQIADANVKINMTMTYSNTTPKTGDKISKVVDESVPIPKDFYYVGGTKNTGVVISDNSQDEDKGADANLVGNQFVWVPVNQNQKLKITVEGKEGITNVTLTNELDEVVLNENVSGKTYNKELELNLNGKYTLSVTTASGDVEKEPYRVSSLYKQDFRTEETSGVYGEIMTLESIKEYAKILSENANNETQESVNTYGGFYIARYEAGDGEASEKRNEDSGDSTLVSKKDVYIYDWINYDDAKAKAESMYTNITSKLMPGAGWDRALNWIVETGGKTDKEVFGYSKDAFSWGNHEYSDNTISTQAIVKYNLKTGKNEKWKANNIYDLSGNASELLDETYVLTDDTGSYRGISFRAGMGMPIFLRLEASDEVSSSEMGLAFRVALYL